MSAILEKIKETAGDVADSPFVQNTKGKLGEVFSPENVENFKGKAGDTLSAALPYLLSGGAGALAGGLLTQRQREDEGESRGEYLRRVLRNAALTGGLASGGHLLLNKGVESIIGDADDRQTGILTGDESTEGPLSSTIKQLAFSPFTAAGAGATGLAMTRKKDLIGVPDTADDLALLAKKLDMDPREVQRLTPEQVGAKVSGNATLERLRRAAGLGSTSDAPSYLQNLSAERKGQVSNIGRRYAGKLLGQTPGRWAGRGAVGLAAASIPALLGAALTDPS